MQKIGLPQSRKIIHHLCSCPSFRTPTVVREREETLTWPRSVICERLLLHLGKGRVHILKAYVSLNRKGLSCTQGFLTLALLTSGPSKFLVVGDFPVHGMRFSSIFVLCLLSSKVPLWQPKMSPNMAQYIPLENKTVPCIRSMTLVSLCYTVEARYNVDRSQ